MSSPVVPFAQVLSNFGQQVSTFEHAAVNDLQTPTLAQMSPVSMLSPSGAASAVGGAISDAIFSSRVVAILLGLVALVGALFLFKGPEIVETGKSAVKDAVLSGAAA